MNQIAQAVKASGKSGDIVVLEGTVDPARDTPARLAAYKQLFGTNADWTLFTAGQQGTAPLWKSLGVYYKKVAEDSPAATDWYTGKKLTYDVDHQDLVMIIGPDQHLKWVTTGTPNAVGTKLPATLDAFLSDEGQANHKHPQDPSWTTEQVQEALSQITGSTITN